ncbi:MAG: hypothetical protein RR088_03950 [Clostridia bacterium]
MKEKFENLIDKIKEKKMLIVLGVVSVLVAISIAFGVNIMLQKPEDVVVDEVSSSSSEVELHLHDIVPDAPKPASSSSEEPTIKIELDKNLKDDASSQKTNVVPNPPKPTPPVPKNEKPVPIKNDNVNNNKPTPPPVTPQPSTYSCGVPGHVCTCEYDHNNVLNWEKDGCEFCGRKDCPSFYSLNKYNGPGNLSLCPGYNEHKNPSLYCQTCGMPKGGGIDHCVKFLHDMVCDDCGVFVKANTCHHCPNYKY